MIYEPNDRVQLAKLTSVGKELWFIDINPVWTDCEIAMSILLDQQGTTYVEIENSQNKFRMIRFRDAEKYGYRPDQVVALRLSEMPVREQLC